MTFGYGIRRPSAPYRLAAHDWTCDRATIAIEKDSFFSCGLALGFFSVSDYFKKCYKNDSIFSCFKKGRSKRTNMIYFRPLLFDVNGLGTRCSLFSRIFFFTVSRNAFTGGPSRGGIHRGVPTAPGSFFQKKKIAQRDIWTKLF